MQQPKLNADTAFGITFSYAQSCPFDQDQTLVFSLSHTSKCHDKNEIKKGNLKNLDIFLLLGNNLKMKNCL